MVKLLLLCLVFSFLSSCHHKSKESEYELLFIPELNDDEFVILTTDDKEALAQFGIVYDMEINNREK